MGETLEGLRRLQGVELQLSAIRRSIEARARRAEVLKRNVAKCEERLQLKRNASRDVQRRVDAVTLDVTSREDTISKHREALNKAKSNKEYAAILTTINSEKADNSKVELEMVRLTDEIQALKKEAEGIEAECEQARQQVAAAEQALRAHEEECREQLRRLEAEREEYARAILPGALAVFTRVAQHHDGEALASIVKVHPKREEYACSGCNMKITLDVANSLRTRDDIQVCSVCGRILCLETSPERSRA